MATPIKYTDLATAFLGDSRAAFEERARGELSTLSCFGGNPSDLLFTTLIYNNQEFIILGKDDHFLVDTSSREEGPVLERGLYKGKKVSLPTPDSE